MRLLGDSACIYVVTLNLRSLLHMHDILLGVLFLCMVLFPAAIAMRSGNERETSLNTVDESEANNFIS